MVFEDAAPCALDEVGGGLCVAAVPCVVVEAGEFFSAPDVCEAV